MSSNYSANQYESAFRAKNLQNWTVPKQYKKTPSPAEGHTVFIATDRGHLVPGVKRGCPRTSFQGTWDLPRYIPPVHINPTARSQEGQQRLSTWGKVQCLVPSATGKLNKTSEHNRTPQCEGASVDGQHEEISEKTLASDGPELERTRSQASEAQFRPTTPQSQDQFRAATQQSHAESHPDSPESKPKSRPLTQASQY